VRAPWAWQWKEQEAQHAHQCPEPDQGTIKEVKKGATTAHVLVDIGDTDIGGPLIMSSITNESVDSLGLKVGGSVYVVVKASDVMIGVD
jgi:molybdopterin-binding protein